MTNKHKKLISVITTVLIVSTLGISHVYAGHHGGGKDKMKIMDTDGDGAVSKEEFMSHKEQRFMKKDTNGDGVLTEDEMKKHCKYKDKQKSEKE